MISLATFRKDDKPNGELLRLLWEPRTGVVWVRRSFGEPRSWPTLYFAKRRFAVDVMIADVWGGRYPQTFRPIPRGDGGRDGATPGPSFRSRRSRRFRPTSQEGRTPMKLEEIVPGLRAGKTAWKRGGYRPNDADRDYYRLGKGAHSGIERVTEYLNPATGRRSEYVRYYRLTRRDFERDDWEFGRFERSTEAAK